MTDVRTINCKKHASVIITSKIIGKKLKFQTGFLIGGKTFLYIKFL
jgi:hypothetical protein